MKVTARVMDLKAADGGACPRHGERGAALLSLLMLASLVLIVCGALILTTGFSAVNAADSTPEMQTYYAAETGLQATLRVLRGHVAPFPIFLTQAPGSAVYDVNKLSFRDAVEKSRSNLATDSTAAGFPARLSHWLTYNYTPPGGAFADRVAITPAYVPATGLAYSVTVEDFDNAQTVSYSTSGTFTGGSCTAGVCSVVIGDAANNATIKFQPQTGATVNALSPVATVMGSLVVTRTGAGPLLVEAGTQFQLIVDQSKPWPARLIIGGAVTGGLTSTSSTLAVTFSNISAVVGGTLFTLAGNPLKLNSAGAPTGTFPIQATMKSPDPRRLRIRSTGYGPGGSRKVLEMLVNRNKYVLDPPAPLVIRGADDTTQKMTFNLGSSNAKLYTGKDASNVQAQLPTIAISLHDWTPGYDGVVKGSTVADPRFSILDINPIPSPWTAGLPTPSAAPGAAISIPPPVVTPDILKNANAARLFLNDMERYARENNRYFTSLNGYAGTTAKSEITFIDGNCVLQGGRGLLIVTGNLDMGGQDDFKGIVMVMGNGRVTRSGTGNGKVLGGWYIAKFLRTGTTGFTAPYIDVSGGGNGTFQFDWKEIQNANNLLGGAVIGIDEK